MRVEMKIKRRMSNWDFHDFIYEIFLRDIQVGRFQEGKEIVNEEQNRKIKYIFF